MRTLVAGSLFTGVAAVVLGLSAPPAFAATWTISGSTGAGGAYTATAGTTTLRDTNTGATLSCSSASAGGAIPNGTSATGAGVGTITSSSFTNCTGPLGITFTVTQVGTWNINAVSPNATAGVVNGTITNVSARLAGSLCSANVTGGVPGTYDNNTAQLSVNPTAPNPNNVSLTVSGVSGCFGLLRNGDTATFTGTYNVAPNTI
ncbi:hypothetical protein, partial [Actinomadura sp. HBU206391]|uniref:hypothetical protein n=1 Tax=Actinomadura sp. HBU206391 TaxID=2731692 RepID=UPI00165087BB